MALLVLDHVQLAMPPGGEDEARRLYGEGVGMMETPKPSNFLSRCGRWFNSGAVGLHFGVEARFRFARKAQPAFETDDLARVEARPAGLAYSSRSDESLRLAKDLPDDPLGNRIERIRRA